MSMFASHLYCSRLRPVLYKAKLGAARLQPASCRGCNRVVQAQGLVEDCAAHAQVHKCRGG